MSIDLFRTLLKRAEGETLDFKQEAHDLKAGRNAFIKDILAMANTPREGDAHIVIGVRWTPGMGAEVVGLATQLDDVEFQSALGDGRVQPRPRFVYEPLEEDGKQVGILTIPHGTDGPYTALKDYDEIQAGVIYYRRGSKNDRAVGTELRRVVDWFREGQRNVSTKMRHHGVKTTLLPEPRPKPQNLRQPLDSRSRRSPCLDGRLESGGGRK